MKLLAGLFFAGLALVLLSCCGRVQSEDQASKNVAAPSNGTSHTTTTPVVKPGTNITSTSQNGTLPTFLPTVPSNTSSSGTTANTTTTTTAHSAATTANTTAAKTSPTTASPVSSRSPSVTAVTPKAPSSANSSAVTATAKAAANLSRSSGFDVGSFIGGIVLTLGLLVIGYIGCRTYHSKRGVQYRTIDEHDAII